MKHTSKLTFILVLILIAFVLLASSHSTYSLKSLEPQVTIEKIYENAVNIDNMSNALNRLHKILEFFENNSHRINVDGLFGLRIAQGVFVKLHELESFNGLNEDLSHKLKFSISILNKRFSKLADTVTALVQNEAGSYFTDFQLLINRPYLFDNFRNLKHLNLNISYNGDDLDTEFNEDFSDKCLSLLMKNNNHKDCQTDSQCFDYFMQENSSEYFLTHQLLYFIIAEHIGCSEKVMHNFINYLVPKKILITHIFHNEDPDFSDLNSIKHDLLNYYCTKIYFEQSQQFTDYKNGKSIHEDLFIEQNLLCGILGFSQFYNEDSLELVGTFQGSSGCLGGNSDQSDAFTVDISLERILDEIESSFISVNQRHWRDFSGKRSKREDMKMKNGCSAHETGLAIAYFSLYFDQALNNLEVIE